MEKVNRFITNFIVIGAIITAPISLTVLGFLIGVGIVIVSVIALIIMWSED